MIIYRYEKAESYFKDGIKIVTKENLIDGDKGICINYLKKKDKDFYRLNVKEIIKGEFTINEKINENEKIMILNKSEFKKFLKKNNKNFLFVIKYITNKK